jgi:hypothetical protein
MGLNGFSSSHASGPLLITRGRLHVIKSWAVRYVVLSEGVLHFYENYDEDEDELGASHGSMVCTAF